MKVGELVKISGGEMDNQLSSQFADITRTILSNQTEALGNLTKKLEKEIGQVWRQMGIMYGQVSTKVGLLLSNLLHCLSFFIRCRAQSTYSRR